MKKLLSSLFIASAVAGCSSSESLQSLNAANYIAPPDTMSVALKGYKPRSGQNFQHLFVSNFSAHAAAAQLNLSTGRDGMPDGLKVALAKDYGFQIYSPESAFPNFADIVLYSLGLKSAQQNLLHCPSTELMSSTNDAFIYADNRLSGSPTQFLGLRDCEKVYLRLDPTKFDNAGNGIPDYMKLRCGINLTNASEAYLSSAGDGVADIDKCKQNIPLNESAFSEPNQLFAYHYNTQLNGDGTTDFTVSNIPIINSGADNFLAFYVVETDLAGKPAALYTAFAILHAGMTGKILNVNYWVTSSANSYNQQIVVP